MAERITKYHENIIREADDLQWISSSLLSVSIYRTGWQNLYKELLASEKYHYPETEEDLKYWKRKLKRVLATLANCGFIKPSDEDDNPYLV